MSRDEKIEQKQTDRRAKFLHHAAIWIGHIGGVLAVLSTLWGPAFIYAAIVPPLPPGMTDPVGVALGVYVGSVMIAYAVVYWTWFWRK